MNVELSKLLFNSENDLFLTILLSFSAEKKFEKMVQNASSTSKHASFSVLT